MKLWWMPIAGLERLANFAQDAKQVYGIEVIEEAVKRCRKIMLN